MAAPLSTITMTIPAGEFMSGPADLTQGAAILLIVPDNWKSANLSIEVSPDDAVWYDLHNIDGKEILLTVTPGSSISLHTTAGVVPGLWEGMWVRLRSGSKEYPVPQQEDVDLKLIFQSSV